MWTSLWSEKTPLPQLVRHPVNQRTRRMIAISSKMLIWLLEFDAFYLDLLDCLDDCQDADDDEVYPYKIIEDLRENHDYDAEDQCDDTDCQPADYHVVVLLKTTLNIFFILFDKTFNDLPWGVGRNRSGVRPTEDIASISSSHKSHKPLGVTGGMSLSADRLI